MGDINKWLVDQIDSNLIPNLMDFVRIPNQSRAFDPEWQTNGMNLKVCQYVKDWAEAQKLDNFTLEILQEEGRTPCLLGILDTPNAANILMYGHLDKQPPLTDQWSPGLHPYDPVIKDGKLYGRGGADDGYAFFSCVLILKALQTFKLPTNRVVLFFETDEESASKDLVYFLEKSAAKVGDLDLVVCLDSGSCDYDHWCLTTTLRGVCNFTMKVEVTKEGVHSGMASGIIPDSFRIGRKLLEQFESSENGQLYVQGLYVNVPDDKYEQAYNLIKELGGSINWKFPFLPGVQPTTKDGFQQYMNRIWMPQLTVIGMDGVPNIANAGNVLRPFTTFGLSVRLPPTLAKADAQKAIADFFDTVVKPYNAKVTITFDGIGQGFNCPVFNQDLKKVIDDAGQQNFGHSVLGYGEGGSIPFINELNQKFPNSQFIVTGVLGPESNAHGPDEFLHIPYLKKLTCALAYVLQNVKKPAK